MNEKQAAEKGLSFTGMCDWDKSTLVPKVDDLRKKGFKAHIVTKPSSPLSRGSRGPMYSVYACRKYTVVEELDRVKVYLAGIPARREALAKRHEAEMNEVNANELAWEQRKEKYSAELVELAKK